MADVRTTTLPDAQTVPEAPPSPTHVAIRRQDYRPPDWLVPEIQLDFDLDTERTRVSATLVVERNGSHGNAIVLNGDGLRALSVKVDGEPADFSMDGPNLVVPISGGSATVETEVEINPAANTKLMGLYASGGMLCTQCEAEGFRRITFFPDRPDVLSRYRVRMEGDSNRFPLLLSNGNRVATGESANGRHWAEWEDPFPKPCYLFALVAGDLKANRDCFTTMSGRKVDLFIWVREADLPKTQHAMDSLKLAMAWDEKVYGREYDLDQFNIVAVSDFNMGAMENKSLNIFNSAYVLADQETATDADFDNIARVVAHEYFHNWSGDRVTCRDWFQLSLKEGFTVFRDQSFSADVGSPPVKRIEDVRVLRAVQFPEDQGPLAHAVRPDSYIEISNFYTATVYNKGAEVIRMFHTVLGADAFRAGTDLYFEREDGKAATCDDFVAALEAGSGADLKPFKIWYSQAGTPKVRARLLYDADTKTATLDLEQHLDPTPGQPAKQPMPIPLKTALIGERAGMKSAAERLIILDQPRQSVRFENVSEPPLLRSTATSRRPSSSTPSARPTSWNGLPRPTPIRSRVTRRCRNSCCARFGRRARAATRCGAGDPGDRRDAQVELARPRVQGRGDPAAERKPDRRPTGHRRSRCDSRVARAAAIRDRHGIAWRIACGAPQRRRFGRRCQPGGQRRSSPADRVARPDRCCRRRRGGCAREGAVRSRRQHDRPPGRARRARVDRGPERAAGARRFLRALPRRPAGPRQMVRAAGRGAADGHGGSGR